MLYLVTGPPAAGKTTWVRDHATHGDITIDYDALANVLTPQGGKPHAWPTAVKAVTKAARLAAIDAAIKVSTTTDVYIIHSSPSPQLLARYEAAGAKFVTVDPGREVVLARAKRERPWQMVQAAKQWYADPQPQQTSTVSQQTLADTARRW